MLFLLYLHFAYHKVVEGKQGRYEDILLDLGEEKLFFLSLRERMDSFNRSWGHLRQFPTLKWLPLAFLEEAVQVGQQVNMGLVTVHWVLSLKTQFVRQDPYYFPASEV